WTPSVVINVSSMTVLPTVRQARICGPPLAVLTYRLRGDRPARPADGLPVAAPHRRPIAQPIRLGELARTPDPSDPDTHANSTAPDTHTKESTA
ncbi:hypothetical protein ABT381_27455, partial [Streptomyces sp. NPDC000151]